MKKKTTITLLLLVFNCIVINAQAPDIQWQKTYGGTGYDRASSIQQTSDGGYIIACDTESTNDDVTGNHGLSDSWIIKINTAGTIEWQKTLGGSNIDIATCIIQTSDGGYIVTNYTLSNDGDVTGNHGSTDAWIVKLSNNGTIQWQKCIGGTGIDAANEIIQNSDGTYVIAGWTESNNGDVTFNQGLFDCWIVKLSSSGNIIWQKTYGGSNKEYARSVQNTTDGGYILAGNSRSTNGIVTGNHGDDDIWIVKLSDIGNLRWQKSLGGTASDIGYSIVQGADGGYVVAGSTLSNDGDVVGFHNYVDYWIVKMSNVGDIQWQKCLGGIGADRPRNIRRSIDGGYITAGISSSDDIEGDVTGNHGDGDYWIVKLNDMGNIDWQKSLGGFIGIDEAYSICQTIDGGYIVAGTSPSNNGDVTGNHGGHDVWTVKLFPESLGNTSFISKGISLYPNPANSLITLQSENMGEITKIVVTDTTGKIIFIQTNKSNSINVEQLSKGMYFLKAFTDKTEYNAKFIKE